MFVVRWTSNTSRGARSYEDEDAAQAEADRRAATGAEVAVEHRPGPLEQRINEIARRINGLRVGEGNETIDVSDLLPDNRD